SGSRRRSGRGGRSFTRDVFCGWACRGGVAATRTIPPARRCWCETAHGKSLASTLGNKRVALMRGHGNVVVGPDVQMAVRYAIYTEVNARLQAAAIAIGGAGHHISWGEGVGGETEAPERSDA